eukprot:scaffold1377_cov220-Pinguiococcus_pyrenoidosus.AAC.4
MTFLSDAERLVVRAGVASWRGEAKGREGLKDQLRVAIEVPVLLSFGVVSDAQQRVGSACSQRRHILSGVFGDSTLQALRGTDAKSLLVGRRQAVSKLEEGLSIVFEASASRFQAILKGRCRAEAASSQLVEGIHEWNAICTKVRERSIVCEGRACGRGKRVQRRPIFEEDLVL